jgi:hypothetical protein
MLSRVTYRPSKKVMMYVQARREVKGRNLRDNEGRTDEVVPTERINYLLNFDFNASEVISLRSRVQGSTFLQEGIQGRYASRGFAAMQDVVITLGKLKLSGRYALFDTEDFENRQYALERNVLYAFAFPAYQGVGVRSYLLAQYKFGRNIDLWVRYAQTSFRDRNLIGSGLQQIDGSELHELTSQVRFKF